MGSLMAGWNSPAHDPKAVGYQRNRSQTRGEIDAYWKSKKTTTEERHLRDQSSDRIQRSSSLPLAERKESSMNYGSSPDGEEFDKPDCWWTSSNWAFLNKPPVTAMEGPSYKYASQYDVADFGSSKTVSNSK